MITFVERRYSQMGCLAARGRRLLWLAAFLCSAAPAAEMSANMPMVSEYSWRLPPAAGELRWVNVKGSGAGILHIEVLARAPKGKPWMFKRLAAHMAITEEALQASVVKPGGYGAAYPEAYYEARARWNALDAAGKAPVCTTSIADCLKHAP